MKKLLSIAAAALLTLALTSCGESDSSAKKVRIGVSIPAADHGWTGGVVWYLSRRHISEPTRQCWIAYCCWGWI